MRRRTFMAGVTAVLLGPLVGVKSIAQPVLAGATLLDAGFVLGSIYVPLVISDTFGGRNERFLHDGEEYPISEMSRVMTEAGLW